MVNNKQSTKNIKCKTSSSSGIMDERQKLESELSFLASLLSQHKKKAPRVTAPASAESKWKGNQFSWTKGNVSSGTTNESSATSTSYHQPPQHHKLSHKQPPQHQQPPQHHQLSHQQPTQHQPPRSNMTWRKPGEAPMVGSKQIPSSKYTFVANRPATSSKQLKSGITLEPIAPPKPVSSNPHHYHRTSSVAVAQSDKKSYPVTKADKFENCKSKKRSELSTSKVQKQEDNAKRQLSTQTSKATLLVKKLQRNAQDGGKERVIPPVSKYEPSSTRSQVGTTKSSTNVSPKGKISHKPKRLVKSEKPDSKKVAILARELDKCLKDIAELKKNQTKAQSVEEKSVVSSTKSKGEEMKCKEISVNMKSNTASETDDSLKGRPSGGNDSNQSVLNTPHLHPEKKTVPTKEKYKWVTPKVAEGKPAPMVQVPTASMSYALASDLIRTSASVKDTRMLSRESSHLGTPKLNSNMKVIRTKYKMKKQLSTTTLHSSANQSLDAKSGVVHTDGTAWKGSSVEGSKRSSRYKFVKAAPDPASSATLSHHQTAKKTPIPVNTRYKMVKGASTQSGAQAAGHLGIPHSSQLKLNRKTKEKRSRPVIPHRSQLKLCRKQNVKSGSRKRSHHRHRNSTHRIDRRTGATPILRSRFKMQKFSLGSPRRTPIPQAGGSSPFKWQAKNLSPGSRGPHSSFMQRRMKYVITHTPVLLRTRFRLINASHSPRPSPRPSPKLPLGPGWRDWRFPHRSGRPAKQPLIKKTRTKLIRKSAASPSRLNPRHPQSFVNAKGVQYRTSRSGRSIRRVSGDLSHHASTYSANSQHRYIKGSLAGAGLARPSAQRISSTQWVANRVLRRTIQSKMNRVNKSLKTKQYCKFYNRYGRCHHGDQCPYIHDPDKVAVCTQFLRGTCQKTDGSCPFSHQVSRDKMPVCVYFLKGVCNHDDCPYSHVKVSKKAEVCREFLHGYCPRGAKCKKKHSLECAEFSETGQCKLGRQCPLWHRGKARRTNSDGRKGVKRRGSEGDKVSTKRLPHGKKSKKRPARNSHGNIDELDRGREGHGEDIDDHGEDISDHGEDIIDHWDDRGSGGMPSFIALDTSSITSTPEDSRTPASTSTFGDEPALKIRPLFASPRATSEPPSSIAMAAGCPGSREGSGPSLSESTSSQENHPIS